MPYKTVIVDGPSGPIARQVWYDPVVEPGKPPLPTPPPPPPNPARAEAAVAVTTPKVGAGAEARQPAPSKTQAQASANVASPSVGAGALVYTPPPVSQVASPAPTVGQGSLSTYEGLLAAGVDPTDAAAYGLPGTPSYVAPPVYYPPEAYSQPIGQAPPDYESQSPMNQNNPPRTPAGTPTPGVSNAYAEVQKRATQVRADIERSIQMGDDLRVQANPKSTVGYMDRVKRASSQDLERLLYDAEEAQKKSNGRYFDPRLVQAAADKYLNLQAQTDKDLRDYMATLDKLSNGTPEDQQKARLLLNSPALQKLMAEYRRVQGVEGAEEEGTGSAFWGRYDRMRTQQESFVSGVVTKSLKGTRAALYGGNNPALMADILNAPDPKKPNYGMKEVRYEDANGALRTKWVPKTVYDQIAEDEAKLQAAYLAERTKQKKAQEAQAIALKRYGVDIPNAKNEGLDPRDKVAIDALREAMKATGITADMIKNNPGKSIEDVVDAALLKFDQQNRAKWVQTETPGGGYGIDAAKMETYLKAREAYEKQLFAQFGTTRRGVLEQTMEVPGIQQALHLLSAPVGAVGTGVKIATMGYGELVGPGFDITQFDPLAGRFGFTTRPNTVLGFGVDQAAETRKRIAEEKLAFDKEFAKGDLGDKLRIVGNYGAEPFSEDSGAANLLFQGVADPLNFFPINFLDLSRPGAGCGVEDLGQGQPRHEAG
jgi:hypothetical protein